MSIHDIGIKATALECQHSTVCTCSLVPEASIRPFLMMECQFSMLEPLHLGEIFGIPRAVHISHIYCTYMYYRIAGYFRGVYISRISQEHSQSSKIKILILMWRNKHQLSSKSACTVARFSTSIRKITFHNLYVYPITGYCIAGTFRIVEQYENFLAQQVLRHYAAQIFLYHTYVTTN